MIRFIIFILFAWLYVYTIDKALTETALSGDGFTLYEYIRSTILIVFPWLIIFIPYADEMRHINRIRSGEGIRPDIDYYSRFILGDGHNRKYLNSFYLDVAGLSLMLIYAVMEIIENPFWGTVMLVIAAFTLFMEWGKVLVGYYNKPVKSKK